MIKKKQLKCHKKVFILSSGSLRPIHTELHLILYTSLVMTSHDQLNSDEDLAL